MYLIPDFFAKSLILLCYLHECWSHVVCDVSQSSLNHEEGMGVISLSVIYGAIILSSMFLPPIMIKNLGCKWTIFISMACYISYSFGNLFPGWWVSQTRSLKFSMSDIIWKTEAPYRDSGVSVTIKDNSQMENFTTTCCMSLIVSLFLACLFYFTFTHI